MIAHRQLIVTEFGGPGVLHVRSFTPPPLEAHLVRLEVEATSASATDTVVRKGLYPLVRSRPPFVLGYEAIGRIVEVGAEVHSISRGARVVVVLQVGANATVLDVSPNEVSLVPDDVPAAELLAFAVSGITAWQAFYRLARLQRGATVLVNGASGAIGTLLVQIARDAGVRVVGTASSGKLARLEHLGATAVDHQSPDLEATLRSAAPGGFDAAFDATGPRGFARSRRLLARGGHLVTFGTQLVTRTLERSSPWALTQFFTQFGLMQAQLALWRLRGHRARFYGVIDHRRDHPDWYVDDLAALIAAWRRKAVQPLVEVLPLDEAQAAHRHLDAGHPFGQIVLRP